MSNDTFRILPEVEPDEIDVELLLFGAVRDPGQVHRIRDAMACSLAAEAAELEAMRASWKQRHPPLLPVEEPSTPAVPDAANRPRTWFFGLALVAAVFLGFVASVTLEPSDGVRPMGSLPVDSWTVRAEQRVASPAVHRAADQVFLRFTMPRAGYVTVALLNAEGGVTLLDRSSASAPIPAGQTYELDGAVQLDASTEREWLVVLYEEQRSTDDQASAAVSRLLPDPVTGARALGWWASDVTRRE